MIFGVQVRGRVMLTAAIALSLSACGGGGPGRWWRRISYADPDANADPNPLRFAVAGHT
jgi:hypothetical protein